MFTNIGDEERPVVEKPDHGAVLARRNGMAEKKFTVDTTRSTVRSIREQDGKWVASQAELQEPVKGAHAVLPCGPRRKTTRNT